VNGQMKAKIWAAVAAFMSVIALAGWLYSRGTLFRLAQIEVEGCNEALAKDVRRRLVDKLGHSLFALSLSQIDNELGHHPQIESVSLSRIWPSTIQILVVERQPVAATWFAGELWMVDRLCRRISLLLRARALPLLASESFSGDRSHESLDSNLGASPCQFLYELRSFEPSAILSLKDIDEALFDKERGVVVSSRALGMSIELGLGDYREKWKRVLRSQTFLNARKLAVLSLDASYKNRVVF
jgi:hypothetical protein